MINAFSLKVALLSITDNTDEYGRQRFKITLKREFMAMPTNITRSEFYESNRSGYKVSRIVKINSFLYKGERYILIDKKVYKIIKIYKDNAFFNWYLTNKTNGIFTTWVTSATPHPAMEKSRLRMGLFPSMAEGST